ncbi:MAG: hypothetical protein HGB10_07270 [Coriobacteriia bacterium]|nr:hypothetical protein [Coriobacteriia bacterium]
MAPKKPSAATRHDRILDSLERGVRAELWQAVGLEQPLQRPQLHGWVFDRERLQESAGERLTLDVPVIRPVRADILKEWGRVRVSATLDRRELDALEHAGDPAPLQAAFYFRRDVFASVYLSDDTNTWAGGARWGEARRASVAAPLALVALAVTDVCAATGCSGWQATGFLLCGDRFPRAEMRGVFRIPGGMHLWAPDPDMTAEQLAAEYAQARQQVGLSKRARGLSGHTSDLVDLVQKMRPAATWTEVYERWNRERPESAYANPDSLRRSYAATLEARRARGMVDSNSDERR